METSEQVVGAVIDTKNQIVQGVGIVKDQVVETMQVAKELAGQAVDATVDKAQEVATYVAEAPSRIAGWFSSKISAFGSRVKDEMTEVAKKIGGDGLIGKAGVALAESVETGFKGLANVVDKTDDAFGYVLSGDLTTDIAKKGLSVFASAHAKAAEKLASLTENIANITDSATDKTIGLLAREIREVTRDLANISSQTGKFLAGDGILGKPFEKAAELYLGFGEQVGGSLDSFQKIIDQPSHDIAQDVKKWKAWTEMMNKKTDQFHYGIDELRSKVA